MLFAPCRCRHLLKQNPLVRGMLVQENQAAVGLQYDVEFADHADEAEGDVEEGDSEGRVSGVGCRREGLSVVSRLGGTWRVFRRAWGWPHQRLERAGPWRCCAETQAQGGLPGRGFRRFGRCGFERWRKIRQSGLLAGRGRLNV